MSLDTLSSGGSPIDGSNTRPVGSGRYGIIDQVRQQQALTIGMAICWEDSADASKRLNVWKFGDSHSRKELGGVCATTGNAPSLEIPICTNNATTSSMIFAGYTPILLAPGESVRHGQYLEPIPSGTFQAMWRVAPSGTGAVCARESFDNSADDATEQLIGADLFVNAATSGGYSIDGAVGPSASLMGFTVETAYNKTVTIPANSLRVGDRLRILSIVKATNGAAGANTVKGYIDGIGSGVLFAAPATTFGANDLVTSVIEAYVAAIGSSGSLSLLGLLTCGAIGTATARNSASSVAIDTTVDNVVTITNTPNNIADASTLLFLSVEQP